MKFKILSIDGGGLRGYATLLILKRIEQKLGKNIKDCFSLIAGTSTGGIIACGLASGLPVQELLNLYKDEGKIIFPRRNGLRSYTSYLCGAEFKNKGLKTVLENYFKEKKLSDCTTPIIIPTYCVSENSPLFFKSRYINISSKNGGISIEENKKNASLVDICMSTSAGPTFLPPYNFKYTNELATEDKYVTCIDGGIYVNNPSLIALTEIQKYGYDPTYNFNGNLKDIFILSIGTGHLETYHTYTKLNRFGKIYWARPLIDIMMNASSETFHKQTEEILTFNTDDNTYINYLRTQIILEDKKLSELTNSSDDAYQYLMDKTHKQVICNPIWDKQIDDFIKKAAL